MPLAAGGGMDITGRAVGQRLAELWGQPLVVENRPGGGNAIGTELVAKAAPDGYTLLMVGIAHAVNPSLYRKLPYNTIADFAPIALIGTAPNILVVHPSLPARSVRELIALARQQPRQINYASAGNGSSVHLASELFNHLARVELAHIPYKGSAPATIDLLGGQVSLMFGSMPPTLPYVKSGRLRALAVTTAKRVALVPDLPTVAEAGVPGFEVGTWYGMLAPARTPRDVIDIINRGVQRSIETPELRQNFTAQGVEPVGGSPESFATYIQTELDKWSKVILAARIHID